MFDDIDEWSSARILQGEQDVVQTTVDKTTRDAMIVPSGKDCGVYKEYDALICKALPRLIFDRYSVNVSKLEGTQAIKYVAGGHFAPHKDTGPNFNNRCFTVLTYLNDDFEGGETAFPDLAIDKKPIAGETIFFLSDYLHAGKPVLAGEKYIMATWFVADQAEKWI